MQRISSTTCKTIWNGQIKVSQGKYPIFAENLLELRERVDDEI